MVAPQNVSPSRPPVSEGGNYLQATTPMSTLKTTIRRRGTGTHAGFKLEQECQKPRLLVARRAQAPVSLDIMHLSSHGFPVMEGFVCARAPVGILTTHAPNQRAKLFCVRVSLATEKGKRMFRVIRLGARAYL